MESDLTASGEVRRLPPKLALVVLFVVSLLTTHFEAGGWNDKSRLAAVESLVEHGTLVIDDSSFLPETHDRVYLNGHYYTDKPVMPSLFGALVYWPLHQLGLNLQPGPNAATYLVTLLTMKVFWAAGLIAFYGLLGFVDLPRRARLVLMFALGFCSLYLSWSSVFNNHLLAASAVIIALYYVVHAKHGGPARGSLAAAGGFFAFAAACDQPTALFGAGFLVYLLMHRSLRGGVVWYVAAGLVFVVPVLAINHAISGSVMPVQINPEHFVYPGSPWGNSPTHELSGVGMNTGGELVNYAWRILFGPKGFVLYNPLLLLAVPALVWVVVKREPYWAEAAVIGPCCLVIVGYYILYTKGYGGVAFGIRWFIALLPVLFLFLYPLMKPAAGQWGKRAVGSLMAVSLFIAMIGLIRPWADPSFEHYPVLRSLALLML